MGLVEEFKKLVDNSDPSVAEGVDTFDLYDHYGLEHEEDVYILNDITDYLFDQRIPKCLECENENGSRPYSLNDIQDQLLLEHFFDGSPLSPFNVLEVINHAIRQLRCFVPFEHSFRWHKAIEAAMDFNIISVNPIFKKSSSQLEQSEPRLYNVAKASKYLRNNGYAMEIKNGEVKIDTDNLRDICNEIEDHIRILGGISFISRLLTDLQDYYNSNLERFNFNRAIGFGNDPLIPIGYLLNLAAKHPYITQIEYSMMWDYYYEYVIQISRNLGAIYNVQPYSNLELLFPGPIIRFIRKTAVFDRMFTIVQLRTSYVKRILEGLFSCIDQHQMEMELGFKLNQYTDIINKIFNLSQNDVNPLIFEKDVFNYPDEDVLSKVLEVLSIDSREVNKKFILPTDTSNFIFKPLIKDRNRYILLNKSWRSPAFYEALFITLINSNWENLDLGIELENFIKSELNSRNIEHKSGHYIMNDTEGDCDIIIESSEFILFFEVKKKALTRPAQSGDDVALIIDLSKSLIDAQLQAGKHEMLLRENGFIEFDDGTRLEHNNRNIDRFAITLLDYGGFQDRNVINHILRIMSTSTVNVKNPKYKSEFEKINVKMEQLQEQSQQLVDYDESFRNFPFFTCWFISLPQLLMLIDDSNDNESFMEVLEMNRSIMYNSLDFYYEYWKLNHANQS